jgi:hypothetical protein
MLNNKRRINILLLLLNIVCVCCLKSQSHKIELKRDNIKFEIEIINSGIYSKNDTIIIVYNIINKSKSDIAIIDTKIQGLSMANPISFNKHIRVLQLDLGGLEIIDEFDSIRKYRVLPKKKKYLSVFSFPVSLIIENLDYGKIEQIQNLTMNKYIEIPIETYIAYSSDKEIINGKFSEILNLKNYIGHLNNINSFDIIKYLQIIKISGIYAKIML